MGNKMKISKQLYNLEVLLCVSCGENPQREYCQTCSSKCSRTYQKVYQKVYQKAYQKAYQKTDKNKAYKKAYYQRKKHE